MSCYSARVVSKDAKSNRKGMMARWEHMDRLFNMLITTRQRNVAIGLDRRGGKSVLHQRLTKWFLQDVNNQAPVVSITHQHGKIAFVAGCIRDLAVPLPGTVLLVDNIDRIDRCLSPLIDRVLRGGGRVITFDSPGATDAAGEPIPANRLNPTGTRYNYPLADDA